MPGEPSRWGAVVPCVLALCLAAPPAAAGRSATITWTAPGDDGRIGRATLYEVRCSLSPITAANFATALTVPIASLPRAAGSPETLFVNGLPDDANVYFAIRARDEAFNWSGLSNLAILAAPPLGLPSEPARSVRFGPGAPNPATDETRFELELARPGRVRVVIHDAAGRRVRVLADGTHGPGRWSERWDLRDEAGGRVRPGVYFALAWLGGSTFRRRVTVVR